MKKQLLLLIMLLLPMIACADDSGSCGDNVYYTYVETTHTLTISGSGKMNSRPWTSYRENIFSVIILDGVTSIGAGAFSGCSSLTSITIPNSVTSIGDGAFERCSGLTSIFIPNSVTSIGHHVFWYCSSLTSIVVENGNTKYDSRNNCNAIIETSTNTLINGCKSTIIPNNVTSIGSSAFDGCSGLTSITIPNSVTSIGNFAFQECRGLTSITIPNSVTSIGDAAFRGCTGLTSIVIENGNTKYDSRDNCNAIIETNSNTLIIGCKNTIIPNSVSSIGDNAFYNCSGLTSITIPNSVTSIGNGAFWGCSGLTSITIPKSVTSIGDYAFLDCFLASVIVKKEIPLSIKGNAFGDEYNATLYVPIGCKTAYESSDNWKEFKEIVEFDITPSNIITFADADVKAICVTNWDFDGNKELSEAEAASVTNIGEVFRDNKNITSFDELKYFTGLKSFGNYAFYNCSGLTSITIPNSVTSIGDAAFQDCI